MSSCKQNIAEGLIAGAMRKETGKASTGGIAAAVKKH
jgi:hypothetical protein